MTPAVLAQFSLVNAKWNAVPYDGLPAPGEAADWWTDIPQAGQSWVCRDYVEAKAGELRASGWSPAALTVILCWSEPLGPDDRREYHAVLGVAVPGNGDETWVLDSRIDDPYRLSLDNPATMPPPANRYLWDRRQVAGSTGFRPIA